jgi:hypothetical protein
MTIQSWTWKMQTGSEEINRINKSAHPQGSTGAAPVDHTVRQKMHFCFNAPLLEKYGRVKHSNSEDFLIHVRKQDRIVILL